MILGFRERRQTVSEADAPPGDQFVLDIPITSLRTSEIAYSVQIRSIIEGQPIIEPSSPDIQDPKFDGSFGGREQNILVKTVVLEVNTSMLSPLNVAIRNDNLPEEEECFELSIRLFPVNPQEMINFTCNAAGDDFLCQHEICIVDDDG